MMSFRVVGMQKERDSNEPGVDRQIIPVLGERTFRIFPVPLVPHL